MEDHTITSTTRDSNTATATPTTSSLERNEPSGSVYSITAPNTTSMDPNQVTRTSDQQYHGPPQPAQNMERSASLHDHVLYESMATTENNMSNTISNIDEHGHCSSIQVKSGNPSAHLDFQTIQPETTMLQHRATHTHESSSPKPSSFFGDGMVSSSSCMKPLRTYSEDDQVEATPQQLRPLHVGTSHAQSSPPFVPVMNPNNTNNNSVRNFLSGKNEAEEHQTTTTANNCNNQKKMMEQKNCCNYTAAAARTDLESSSNITIPTTITTENSHPTISTTTTTDYYQQAPLPSLFSSSSSSGFLSQQAPQFRPLVSATSMTCLPPPSLLLLQEHEQQQQGRMISSIPPWMHQPQSSQTESSGSTTTTTTTESIQIGDDNSHVHRRMHASSGGAGVVHGGTMPIPVSNVHLTYPTLHPPSSSSAATPPPQQQNTNADGSVHSTTKFNNKMMTNREGGNTNHTSNTISNSTSSSSRNQNVSKQKSATTMKQDGKKAMNNHNMGDGTLSESKTCVICGKADTGNKYISYTINESNIAQYRGCFAHVPNINIGDGVCKNCYAKKYKFVTGLSINKVKRKPGSTPQTTQPQAQPSLPSSASQQSHTPSSNSSKPPYLTSNVATNVVPPTSHSPPPLKKNSTAPPLLPTATKVGNYQKHHHSLYTQPPVSSAYHHHHAGIAGYISPSVGENPMSGYPYCEGEVYSSGNSSENAYHHHEGYYQQQQQQQPGEMYTHQQYSSQYLPAQHRLSSHETRSSPTHSREYLYHPYSRPTSSQRSNYDYHSSVAHQQPYAPSPSSYHHADAYRAPPVMTQRGSRAVSPIVRASNGPYYSTPEHSVQLIERTSPYMNSNSPPYHTSPSNELAYSGSSGDASFPAIMTASDSSNRRESKHSLPSHRYHPYASSSNPYSRSSESQNDGVNNPVMNSSVSEISPPALSRNLPYGVVATGVAVSSQETRRRETRISQYDPLKDTTNAPNNLPDGVQSKQDHRITENVSANDSSRSKLPSVKDLLNFPSETDSNTGDPSGMKEAKNQNEKQQFSFFSELIDDTSKKKLPMIDEKNQMDKLNLKDISQQRMVDIILSFVNEKVSSEAISTRMSIPRRVTLSDLRENINERARKCYMMDGCLTHTPNVGNILLKRDERNFIEIDDNFCLSNRFENNDMLRVVLQLTE